MSGKKEYIVTHENTAGLKRDDPALEVGSAVELTDSQAASRVNKVRLKDAYDAEVSKAGRKSKMEADNKALTEENTVLTQRVSELEAQNLALKGEIDKAKVPAQ